MRSGLTEVLVTVVRRAAARRAVNAVVAVVAAVVARVAPMHSPGATGLVRATLAVYGSMRRGVPASLAVVHASRATRGAPVRRRSGAGRSGAAGLGRDGDGRCDRNDNRDEKRRETCDERQPSGDIASVDLHLVLLPGATPTDRLSFGSPASSRRWRAPWHCAPASRRVCRCRDDAVFEEIRGARAPEPRIAPKPIWPPSWDESRRAPHPL